ncbi:MAG TPA: CAP domain-containing protein [Candidatus Angelobacter sp.]|nr:CAP domain-containing protein [Candidatus Angelobacter sp.]
MQRVIIAIMFQALALTGAAQAPPAPAAEQQMLKLLNIERQHAGLPLFEWNAQLAQAAQAHSRKLASHGDLSHRFPGEPELTERVGATGARFNALAENVAVAGDPQEAHLALMSSPGHRANILNPEYNAVGVAITSVNNDMYVTEDFAHVVPVYSEDQFRSAVLTAFNQARKSHHIGPIVSYSDPQLDHAACSGRTEPKSVLGMLPGATQATIFTASEPGELPPTLEKAAGDFTLRRMSIGLCFRSDPGDKVSKFWVIAAFFTGASAPPQAMRVH